MQTSIPVFALCAVALYASAPALTAQDKPIQSGVITNRPASGFAPVPAQASPDAASKLESALHQKMSELGAQAVTPPPTNALKPAPVTPTEKQGGQAAMSRSQQKALEREEKQAVEAAMVQAPETKLPKRETNVAPIGFEPLLAPPPPVSAAQQAQLDELLQRYKADQITPEQYFTERAKIMSGK